MVHNIPRYIAAFSTLRKSSCFTGTMLLWWHESLKASSLSLSSPSAGTLFFARPIGIPTCSQKALQLSDRLALANPHSAKMARTFWIFAICSVLRRACSR